jgi:hypothetical protein
MRNSALFNSAFGFFLLIGLAIMGGSLYFGWRTATKVKAVESWPTAPAYIIESRIEWEVEGHDHAGTTRSYSYAYRLSVLAGYQVDNEFYSSTTPAIKTISDSKVMPRDPWRNPPDTDIVTLFKQVPQGAVVPIHYNPINPKEAYLFSKLSFWQLFAGNVIGFLFGILPTLFGLVPLLLQRKYFKNEDVPEQQPGLG